MGKERKYELCESGIYFSYTPVRSSYVSSAVQKKIINRSRGIIISMQAELNIKRNNKTYSLTNAGKYSELLLLWS